MEVRFSKIAKQTLSENIIFLKKLWTNREVSNFLKDVKGVINNLENGNYNRFQNSVYKTKSALIGKKHVRMFFRKENDNLITVLLFFDMRQDSNKILELLK